MGTWFRQVMLAALFGASLLACEGPRSPSGGAERATMVVRSANATNTALARVARAHPTDTLVPTPTRRARKTPTPSRESAALPRGYSWFASDTAPYSVGYPSSWSARGDAFRWGNLSGDIFVGMSSVSINVVSEPIRGRPGMTSEEYVEVTLAQVAKAGPKVRRVGQERVLRKYRAILISYQSHSGLEGASRVTQALWAADGRGWVFTLMTPVREHDRYMQVLRTMLRTFTDDPNAPSGEGVVS
ncbi:MAG: hypothetical protein M3281_09255 [Chloroflexota bacterium]|nr:hypothetical protein [Chloroflexota bacterium]